MTNLHNGNHTMVIIDRVHDAVVALANAVVFLAEQFLMAWRTGILCETANTVGNAPEIGFWKRPQLSLCRFFDDQAIRVRHA